MTVKPSQATDLVALAEELYTLARSERDEPLAIPRTGPYIARVLRGRGGSLRADLAARFAELHGKVPSSQALADALLVLQGRAAQAAPVRTALRLTRSRDAVILDLGDPEGEVIEVTAQGWRSLTRSPVLLRRTELTGPLPYPVRGGSLERLRELVNVADDDWPLLVGWLVAALLCDIPHPILALLGEQGCGKSTVARLVVGLLDASPAPLRKPPRDAEGWVTAAAGSWMVALDNLSAISGWLADSLCRAVTGEGDVRRALYTDGDLRVFAFRRVLILTSIDPGAIRGDLGERLLPLDLARIDGGKRRLDREIAEEWERIGGHVLGGLLDLTAQVLQVLPDVTLDDHPRMADFAQILAAVDAVTGGKSLAAYLAKLDAVAVTVVESDLVASAVHALLADREGWEGTAGELLEALSTDERRRAKGWPSSPRGLSAALSGAAPALRAVGVAIDHADREGGTGRRIWTLAREQSPG